ncbi:hypothetical protein EK21DRAFT_89849 [Setomelanomma holmii]|uniref:Uncharacterized protein n=1 Tax=Setomelanomma holmii TaxID=210430 RepID=A0A9P4LN07_9PLEO|nr:hypothetical protein EK21DRAFT_89849 [Setomelanomma holmii]
MLHPFVSSRQRRKPWDDQDHKSNGDSLYQLFQKVHAGHDFRATVGCDMIYRLCGLANDTKELGVVLRYPRKEAEEEEVRLHTAMVYTDLVRKIIEKTGSVDLLTFSQYLKKDMTLPSWVPYWQSHLRNSFPSTDKDKAVDYPAAAIASHLEEKGLLPSWVPNWRVEIDRSFAWMSEPTQPPLFNAYNGQPLELSASTDYGDTILALEGCILDEIEEIGGLPVEELYEYLSQVQQMCLLSRPKVRTYTRTLKGGMKQSGEFQSQTLIEMKSIPPIRAKKACKLKCNHCLAQLELQTQFQSLSTLDEYKAKAAQVDAMDRERASDTDGRSSNGSLFRIRMQDLVGKRPFLSKIGCAGMVPIFMRP